MKYKLIKIYPKSPKLGTIIEFGTGWRETEGWIIDYPKEAKEFWEEVQELSVPDGSKIIARPSTIYILRVNGNYVDLIYNTDQVYSKHCSILVANEFIRDGLWTLHKEPLFTTFDGVDIYEGDTYWCINTAPHLWSLFEQTSKTRTQLNKTVIAFSTYELAQKYIVDYKPLYSRMDILNAITNSYNTETAKFHKAVTEVQYCKLSEDLIKQKLGI